MDLLPQVQSDFIEEAPEPLKEEEESDDSEGESGGPNFIYEDIVPTVEKKAVIPEESIFVEKKVKKELSVAPVKQDKRKRVMTEEQLERLRLGREKGLAKRRAAAAEKKEIQELTTKKKKKEIQKLRDEVADPVPTPAPEPAPAPAPKPRRSTLDDLSPELLVQLQQQAIEGYDLKRKARKAKKKEEESKKSETTHFRSMVSNAVKPQQPARYGDAGFFNHLF
tara:strand:- start:4917 stop:5585 length:669 start_codon:yes stop_codon:yes gene_type:complete